MLVTALIIKNFSLITSIRVSDDEEDFGLAQSQHGEKALSV